MSSFDDELREYERLRQEKNKTIIDNLIAKIPLGVGILIAIWWIFYGTISVDFKFSTIFGNVILTIATIIFAITYCNLIAEGGFTRAEKSDEYKESQKLYRDAVSNGFPYQKEIIEYAKGIALENLKEARKQNLESNFLKYTDFYDENDKPIKVDFKARKDLSRHQKKIIKRCARMHISIPKIFDCLGEGYFGLKREKSKKEYITSQQTTKAITRTILSFVSLSIAFTFVGFNVSGVIYAFFQIVLWTASGVSQRIKNQRFVIETLMPQMDSKTLIINGYLKNMNKNKTTEVDINGGN